MLELRLFGTLDLRGADGRDLGAILRQPKRAALLAYLAATAPGGFQRRDTLLGLFWPELDTPRARDALSSALRYLRQGLGAGLLVNRGDEEVGLAPNGDSAIWCDVAAFEGQLKARQTQEALGLYRGDLLEGFYLSDAPAFGEWLERERARLRKAAADAARQLSEEGRAAGELTAALAWARRALDLQPDDERALRRLIALSDDAGDRAGALRAYESFARRLREEYESDPAPETTALIEGVRARVIPDSRSATPSPIRPEPNPISSSSDAPSEPASTAQSARPVLIAARRRVPWTALVPAGLLLGTLAAWPLWRSSTAPVDRGAPISIAVLPMRNLGDSSDASLAEGLPRDLTNELTRVDGLSPRPFETVLREFARSSDPVSAGRRLSAQYVLSTTLQRAGQRFKVRAELIRVSDGSAVWAPRPFEGTNADVFAMQDTIARHVVSELKGGFAAKALALGAGQGKRDVEAYRLFQQGQRFLRLSTLDGATRAIPYFEQAIARDSSFADAWAALGSSYDWMAQFSGRAPIEILGRARNAAERAAALDSSSGGGLSALARYHLYFDFDVDAYDRAMRRVLALNPGSAIAHFFYGQDLRMYASADTALAEIRRALELDPTNAFIAANVADMYAQLGRFDDAIAGAKRALAMDSTQWLAHMVIGVVAERRGDDAEAARAHWRAHQAMGTDVPWLLAYVAYYDARAGLRPQAEQTLAKLKGIGRREYVQPVFLATAKMGLGDRAGALDDLEASLRARDRDFFPKVSLGEFEELRGEPRYEAVIRRVGLDRYMRAPGWRPAVPLHRSSYRPAN